jgi:uncharacterized membrane protein YkvA (DUF1232 family)
MKYSLLFNLIKESGLSPEQLAARLGLSGMTLRRWQEESGEKDLPKMYEWALIQTVYQLISEGHLSVHSTVAKMVFKESSDLSLQAALKNLGLSEDFLNSGNTNSDRLMTGLAQMGTDEKKQSTVNKSKKKILSFKKMGNEWGVRISTLLNVLKSKKLTHFDKLAAYGALFYLITIFDLIPDHIPFFGLLDDFAIMGFVTAYYLRRFSWLSDMKQK